MNADNWKEIIFILIGAGVGFLISNQTSHTPNSFNP